MSDSVVYQLAKKFAIRVIHLNEFLVNERQEYVMSRQICKSGTSIGANLAESKFAQSSLDYKSKLKIALKEANETLYWLDLLYDTAYISQKIYDSMSNDTRTIIGTLVNIINKIEKENHQWNQAVNKE